MAAPGDQTATRPSLLVQDDYMSTAGVAGAQPMRGEREGCTLRITFHIRQRSSAIAMRSDTMAMRDDTTTQSHLDIPPTETETLVPAPALANCESTRR
jgi:hypothetical protein